MLHYAYPKSIVYPLNYCHLTEFQENVANIIVWNEITKWLMDLCFLYTPPSVTIQESEYYDFLKHMLNEKLIALQYDVIAQDAVFWLG